MKKIDRRNFLKTVGLAGGMVAISGPKGFLGGIAYGAPTFTGVTYLTPGYQDLFPAIQAFVAELKKNAGDKFKVDFFDSQTLVKAAEQNSALRAGTIQFMFHTSSYITRTFKILGITGLPGIVDELYKHPERLAMESPIWKACNDNLAKENIFQLTMGGGILEPEYIWSGAKQVKSLKDLNGKRCRIVSYEATEALKKFGAAGVNIPSSELYLAVQRGTVDAVVANVSTIISRKVHEQLKYVYKMPVTAFTISIFLLKDKWDQMPADQKDAFWKAAKYYDDFCAPRINSKFYPEVYWPVISKAKIEIVEPTKDESAEFAKQSQVVIDWWKNEVGEAEGQKVIDMAMGKA
jgi:TRAP-type C4-dicarboxylate transport system substrate-binding protein